MRGRLSKPDGGYCIVGAFELLWVYFAYEARLIRWGDLRVWFACKEALARRCGLIRGRVARYGEAELAELVCATSVGDVRAALRRLELAGLVQFRPDRVRFAASVEELRIDDPSDFWSKVRSYGHKDRKVPVPRRVVRLVASGCRKTMTGTLLGHILRCCYLKGAEYSCVGSCAASWVAEVFSVDERHVKRARKRLAAMGLLLPKSSAGWHRQRYGASYAVSPRWAESRNAVERNGDASKRPPRCSPPMSKRPPLLILKENSFGVENQKPATAADRPGGVRSRTGDGNGKPSMRHVTPLDIQDTRRLVGEGGLFEDAVRMRLVSPCQADRLKFVAAAERAVRASTRNLGGFFTHLVRNKLWHYITLEQEDAARVRLRRFTESVGNGEIRGKQAKEQSSRPTATTVRGDVLVRSQDSQRNGDMESVRDLVARSLALAADGPLGAVGGGVPQNGMPHPTHAFDAVGATVIQPGQPVPGPRRVCSGRKVA